MGESKKAEEISSDLNNGGWSVGLAGDDGVEDKLWIWGRGGY
jgi:hypothetical protein